MSLDNWQKIVDISMKGVATVAIAGGTLWYTAQRFEGDKSKICTESLDQAFQMVIKNSFSDSYKAMLDWRIKTHEQLCGKLDDKMVNVLNNSWQPSVALKGDAAPKMPQPDSAGSSPKPAQGDGPKGGTGGEDTSPAPVPSVYTGPLWVASARRNDPAYSATNFDVTSGNKSNLNAVGNVLSARWFVNIRAKNTPVSKGDNPVVGQLVGGECVRVLEYTQGQLNDWIRVTRSACQ